MVRPTKQIPFENIKGLKTLLEEVQNQTEIATYYSEKLGITISQQTISNKIRELKNEV